jgi:hypothetical protein
MTERHHYSTLEDIVRLAQPGCFICADCRHERDLLTNTARTINGAVYCGGCAASKRRLEHTLQRAVDSEAMARKRQRAPYLR